MYNLIIDDEEFEGFSESIGYLTTSLENRYASIVNKLRLLCTEGVTEGAFHDNLVAYVEALDMMQGQLQFVTEELQRLSAEFIAKIDEIDGAVYDEER
ncbi:MAG: hypothetical protein NC393_09755 [Clostridium sp.]|nr:hypothetical protein [Clostridium sp.]MCM1172397.1 hypothetical protein [Clostridium sp.]